MSHNLVYIELGGNQGDRMQLIKQAKIILESIDCKIIKESSIYETPPWGFEASQNFYNQIVLIETSLNAQKLLSSLLKIEAELGRIRRDTQYSSRTMDIDILFFNDEIYDFDGLKIPHERLHLRKFVLIPMNEIAPDFIHPLLKQPISLLLYNCPDAGFCEKKDR